MGWHTPTCNLSAGKPEARWRPAWSTQWALGQPGQHSKSLSQTNGMTIEGRTSLQDCEREIHLAKRPSREDQADEDSQRRTLPPSRHTVHHWITSSSTFPRSHELLALLLTYNANPQGWTHPWLTSALLVPAIVTNYSNGVLINIWLVGMRNDCWDHFGEARGMTKAEE